MRHRHSLLKRQLKRHFPDDRVPETIQPLLNDVAEAYLQFDADRGMLERSLDLSSQELLQANAALGPALAEVLHTRKPASVEVELRHGPLSRVYEARVFPIDIAQTLVILRDV